MHQFTTPSLSQTIWPSWASRQFFIVQILLPVTFGYPLSSKENCHYETIEAVTKVIDTLTKKNYHGAFQKLLERYNKFIVTGGDYFMCVLSIKVPIRKQYGNLFNDPCTIPLFKKSVYIYIYTYSAPWVDQSKKKSITYAENNDGVRYLIDVKSAGFNYRLEASRWTSHTEKLWYNEIVHQWMTVYVYIIKS